MVLGLAEVARYSGPGSPRFVVAALHRNVSLLGVAFLAVHVAATVFDTFVTIRVVDVFVPFSGHYRGLWLGIGAISLDLMVAIGITSVVRGHLGYRAWQGIHLTAYACWPLAVAHGLGIGTDTPLLWVQLLNGLCVAAVVGALAWRLRRTARLSVEERVRSRMVTGRRL